MGRQLQNKEEEKRNEEEEEADSVELFSGRPFHWEVNYVCFFGPYATFNLTKRCPSMTM